MDGLDPFPKAGIEVRLLGETGTKSIMNNTVRMDDTINVVGLKLKEELGEVYWWICVHISMIEDDLHDIIESYETPEKAVDSVLGPGSEVNQDAILQSEFAYMCPYLRGCGHPGSFPTKNYETSFDRLLEEFNMYDQGSGPVIFAVTKEWLTKRKAEKFAMNPQETDHSRSDSVIDMMSDNKDRLKYTSIGSTNATVTHLLAPGSSVPVDGLQGVFNNLVASANVPMVVYQRLDGTQSSSIWAPKVRERVLNAADVDDITNKMLESGTSSLFYMVSVPFCDSPVKVRIYPDLSADITLTTSTDMISRIQEAMTVSETYSIIKSVYNVEVKEVQTDIMEVGLMKIYKRVILHGTKDISVNSLIKGLDMLSPVVSYTKNEHNVIEVFLTRTSGFETPTEIKKSIMKHHDLLSKGSIDELNIVVQEDTGASQTEVETEIDAYIQKIREVNRSGRFNMSHVDTTATIKAMSHGIVISFLGTRSIKYTERLLWCLLNMNKTKTTSKESQIPEDADLDDTQAILAMIQNSNESEDSGWEKQEGLDTSGNYLSSKYVLNRLYMFDKDLFTYKKDGYAQYSKMCGAVDKRQPVAVSQERLTKIKETHQISSVSTAKGDAYICPEVWCPATETVMTMEEYKKNGSVCESTNKPGVVLSDTKYWNGATDRFVGFLRPDKHPTGMCMPCCFRRDPNANPAGQDRMAKCGNASPDNEASHTSGKKYIMGSSQIPLPPERKGDLPVGSTLSNLEFIRYGVNQTQDGFMESVAVLLSYTSTEKLREDLSASVTISSMLSTGRDGILQRFIDYKNSPAKEKQFRDYLKTSAGADQMNLSGIKKGLMKLESKDPMFLRELALWDAMTRFKKYVLSDSVGHSLVLPFLQLMNRSILISVIEIINGEEVIHMPLGGVVDPKVSKVGIIMRHEGGIYEPIVIRGKGTKVIPEPLSSLHPVASQIIRLQKKHKELEVKNGIHELELSLKKRHLEMSAHVFTEKMLCAGVVLENGLFVPTGVPDGTTVRGIKRIIYLDKLLDEPISMSRNDAITIFESLNLDYLSKIDDVKDKGGRVVALRVMDYYVPLQNSPELSVLFSTYNDVIHHFLKTTPTLDSDIKARFGNKEGLLKAYDAMMHHLRTNHINELFVLTHPLCPYSMSKRMELMMELTSPVLSDSRDSIARNASRMILTRQRRQVTKTSKSNESSDIIRATEDDVIDGTLVSVVTTASRSLEYLNIIRKVLSTSQDHDNHDKIRAAFSRPISVKLVPGLQFNETKQMGTNVIYAMGVAATYYTGKKDGTSVFDYVSDVVETIISEYELQGEESLSKKLYLNSKVLEAVREELSVARPGLDKRLKAKLTRPGVFLVGPGDVARFFSKNDVVAVIYSDFAPTVVEGSGTQAVVGHVSKEGNLALALRQTDDGTTCLYAIKDLPKELRNVISKER